MPYTNTLNLPPAVVVAVLSQQYSKDGADYSVTELLSPPRIGALRRRYNGKIFVDVADELYSLAGSIGHGLLERAAREGNWRQIYLDAGLELPEGDLPTPELVEERFTIEMDGARISGCPDSLLAWPTYHVLDDWKYSTVYAVMSPEGKPEWTAQLNIYRYVLHVVRPDLQIDKLRICIPFFRDWSKRRARREPATSRYPRHQGHVMEIETWPLEQTAEFITERIRLHREADALPDHELPLCTDDERWMRPAKWAVTAPNRKRALRLYDTEDEAQQHALTSDKLVVERRPSEPVRCLDYCPLGENGLCTQWEAERAAWDGKASDESSGEAASSIE